MGNCKYCGQSAGLLRSKHPECGKKYEQGKNEIVTLISQTVSSSDPPESIDQQVKQIAERSYIPVAEQEQLLLRGFETAVDQCLEDGILDESEEKRIAALKNCLSASRVDLEKSQASSRVVKAAVIRDVLHGVLPERVTIQGSLPINFQKGEKVVWAFPNCDYLEDRTRRHYVGGSRGVSIRIMRGVYYRAGAFKAEPVDRTERVRVDNGWVVMTSKNIYFAGSRKSLRIPYSKVVSVEPFSDGVGVMRDAANAKPQIFVTGDGWFSEPYH